LFFFSVADIFVNENSLIIVKTVVAVDDDVDGILSEWHKQRAQADDVISEIKEL